MISVTKKNNFYVTLHDVPQAEYNIISRRLSHRKRVVVDGHYSYETVHYPVKSNERDLLCDCDIPTALLPWLTKFIQLPIRFTNPKDYFKVSEEDYQFLSTQFKVNVAELVDQILAGPPRSLVQLPTGTGKTFILATLIKSYTGDGNILIMSPSSMVRNEIAQRTGIGIGFNPKNKACIVDYAGFGRSNKIDSEVGIDWLSKVDLVLYDESEALPEGTEYILTGCTNARFFYGFSANPDAISDKCLYKVETLNDVLTDTFDIMKYFGVASVYMDNVKPINLKIMKVNLHRFTKMSGDLWVINYAFKQFVKESFYPKMFMTIINRLVPGGVLFCFIPNKDPMLDTSEMLDSHGVPHICWSADCIEHVHEGIVDNINYDQLKQVCEEGKVKVIMATTVAKRGVNILQITDVLLISGNKFGNLNQIIGRVRTAVFDKATNKTIVRTPNVWTYDPQSLQGTFNFITGKSRIRLLSTHYECKYEIINLMD